MINDLDYEKVVSMPVLVAIVIDGGYVIVVDTDNEIESILNERQVHFSVVEMRLKKALGKDFIGSIS